MTDNSKPVRSSDNNLEKLEFVSPKWFRQNRQLNDLVRMVTEVAAFGEPGNPIDNFMNQLSDPEALAQRLKDTMTRLAAEPHPDAASGAESSADTGLVHVVASSGSARVPVSTGMVEALSRKGHDHYFARFDLDHRYLDAGDKNVPQSILDLLDREKIALELRRVTFLTEALANREVFVKVGDAFVPFSEDTAARSEDGRLYGRGGSSLGDIYNQNGLAGATVDDLKLKKIQEKAGRFFDTFDLEVMKRPLMPLLPGGEGLDTHAGNVTQGRLESKDRKQR